jgi:hypothetical protein
VVEAAVVLTLFLMFLFGVFEYCRFLLVLHVTNNAARDGARYAAVSVNTLDAQAEARRAEIVGYTTARMGGADRQLGGFRVAVYPCDPAGLVESPPVARPKTRSTASPPVYPDPFDPADPNTPAWNQASFSERIAVRVRGTYTPVTPLLLFLPSRIPIDVTAVAGSEG